MTKRTRMDFFAPTPYYENDLNDVVYKDIIIELQQGCRLEVSRCRWRGAKSGARLLLTHHGRSITIRSQYTADVSMIKLARRGLLYS